jgi:hypothetical protein
LPLANLATADAAKVQYSAPRTPSIYGRRLRSSFSRANPSLLRQRFNKPAHEVLRLASALGAQGVGVVTSCSLGWAIGFAIIGRWI